MPDYSRYKTLDLARRGKVLRVYMNRPDALNAVNAEMHAELSTVFADIGADSEIGAVLLTGKGKAFCAGGDLNWIRDVTASGIDIMFYETRKIIVDLLELEIPVIAAINGHATGLGATIALFSDVIFMASDAKIGDPHVRIGLVAGDGGAIIWPWLVGMAHAKELLLTGNLIDAATAKRLGLVNHVLPNDEVVSAAEKLTEQLANGPTIAIRGIKACLNKLLRESVNLVLDTSIARERLTLQTDDHREGLKAFLEKREATFNGS